MSDKAEVIKWFAGRKVEVLDDQKGRTTVSAWREQLLNAAGRMSGATGRKMLQGQSVCLRTCTAWCWLTTISTVPCMQLNVNKGVGVDNKTTLSPIQKITFIASASVLHN